MNNKLHNYLINSVNKFNVRLLELDKEALVFTFFEGELIKNEIRLSIGYEQISKNYFKHSIPTEAEIDYAINVIEDALMSNKACINNNEQLICADKLLIEMLTKNIESKTVFTRQEIEDLFSKYASITMGAPLSRYNIEVNTEDYARLLSLREIMHHLNFEELIVLAAHN